MPLLKIINKLLLLAIATGNFFVQRHASLSHYSVQGGHRVCHGGQGGAEKNLSGQNGERDYTKTGHNEVYSHVAFCCVCWSSHSMGSLWCALCTCCKYDIM